MVEIHEASLFEFVRESNRIEGILRGPTDREITATRFFLQLEEPTLRDLSDLVRQLQPDAVLRDRIGMDVRVGDYFPPRGGPFIVQQTIRLLSSLSITPPWQTHIDYESLHPFTDGNGRSGRTIWAWQMLRRQGGRNALSLGFLHRFYYQTLQQVGRAAE